MLGEKATIARLACQRTSKTDGQVATCRCVRPRSNCAKTDTLWNRDAQAACMFRTWYVSQTKMAALRARLSIQCAPTQRAMGV